MTNQWQITTTFHSDNRVLSVSVYNCNLFLMGAVTACTDADFCRSRDNSVAPSGGLSSDYL